MDVLTLDDADALATSDPGGMLRAVATGGAQLRASWRSAAEAGVGALADAGRPRAVVVAGVGGSGQAGAVLSAVAGVGAPVPLVQIDGPVLPGWVGPMDLVCAVSSSGRTGEVITAVGEAVRRGCQVVGVGPGQSLLAAAVMAGREGVFVPVDAGDRPPRTNLWGLAAPLLAIGRSVGLISLSDDVVERTATALDATAEQCGPASSVYVNPAKSLALDLAGALPLVWGTGDAGAAAAVRFCGQLQENAKLPAVAGVLPEAGHNQIVAFDGPFGAGRAGGADGDFFRDRENDAEWPPLRLVLVRDAVEHPMVAAQAHAIPAVARARNVEVSVVQAEGATALERTASLSGMLDFAGVYVALAAGIDPAPIGAIDELKDRVTR